MDNHVTVTGNVTRDPELKYVASGQACVKLGLACNRRWMDKASEEWKESTSFFDVVCWGELAEHVSESVAKGSRVTVNGRLEQRTWEQDDGAKRSMVEISADDVSLSLRFATGSATKVERKTPATSAPGSL